MLDKLVSAKTLGETLQLEASTLRDWARRRVIPSHRVGRLWRFDVTEVRAWLNARRRGPQTPTIVYEPLKA